MTARRRRPGSLLPVRSISAVAARHCCWCGCSSQARPAAVGRAPTWCMQDYKNEKDKWDGVKLKLELCQLSWRNNKSRSVSPLLSAICARKCQDGRFSRSIGRSPSRRFRSARRRDAMLTCFLFGDFWCARLQSGSGQYPTCSTAACRPMEKFSSVESYINWSDMMQGRDDGHSEHGETGGFAAHGNRGI